MLIYVNFIVVIMTRKSNQINSGSNNDLKTYIKKYYYAKY